MAAEREFVYLGVICKIVLKKNETPFLRIFSRSGRCHTVVGYIDNKDCYRVEFRNWNDSAFEADAAEEYIRHRLQAKVTTSILYFNGTLVTTRQTEASKHAVRRRNSK